MKDKKDSLEPPYISGTKFSRIKGNPLDFLRTTQEYCFRRHFREGLRSHIFELILTRDLETEQRGKIIDNIRQFPRARPIKMLRILKHRFNSLNEALGEIEKYRILLTFLGPALVAKSEEFVINNRESGENTMLLCGLQEYVEGNMLDPWYLAGKDDLKRFFRPNAAIPCRDFILRAAADIKDFVKAVRTLISEKGYIPDLAGIGNLMLTEDGRLKLVDINNIIKIKETSEIGLDDKGYPCCDKSVEVLSILEHRILQQPIDPDDPVYKRFLSPGRREQVTILENIFYQKL